MALPKAQASLFFSDGTHLNIVETLAWITAQVAQPINVGGMPVTPIVHEPDGTLHWVNLRLITHIQQLV